MNYEDFKGSPSGQMIQIPDGNFAFVPNKLPPTVEITWELAAAISQADRQLSELSGAASKLPNPHLLIIPFTRKEAVLSSRIEGTVASLSDLLSFEAVGLFPEGKKEDVREVANYVQAMEWGLQRLRELPISLRLIRELHERLLRGVRGENMMPGQFRNRQNWLGPPNTKIEDAIYVPPPLVEMGPLLDDLEKYIHSSSLVPPLVRLAIAHYQFEAIHPFLDGNGRIGRLLITLTMISQGLLTQPLLYLSAYFERSRAHYYDHLLAVSQRGAWAEWINYFLGAVAEQAKQAMYKSSQLMTLNESYRNRIQRKRTSAHSLTLLDDLFSRPVTTAKRVRERLGITAKSAQQHIDRLIQEKILIEATGKQRNRIYLAPEILGILEDV
jgi:Fic family protein